jgi:hypothetical protein
MNKPKSDLDYVELYAEELKKNSERFKEQKKFIEAQLKASSTLFKNAFSGEDFKKNAREYLQKRMIIS